MGCDVCLVMDVDEPNEFFSASDPIARKPHQCCECRQVIAPGARYRREAGKSEGTMWTYTTCALCVEIRDVFRCGGAWLFTVLWDEMEEQAFPDLTTESECFRELSADAKNVVLDRWRQWKGLPT